MGYAGRHAPLDNPSMRAIVMRIVIWLGILAVAALALKLFMRWIEPRIAFHPIPGPTPPPPGFERFEVTAADGVRIVGWKTPLPADEPVLLYCCGNAGNLTDRTDLLFNAAAHGLRILAFNYRGTGESGGRATEEGVYLDAAAVYDHAVSTRGSSDGIIPWGHSIGGVVAVELAHQRPCAALILESTFRSGRLMARRIFPFLPTSWLMSYVLDNETKLPQLTVPVLLIHGTADRTIPVEDSQVLHGLGGGPRELWLIDGADHNDTHEVAGAAFYERIAAFVKQPTGQTVDEPRQVPH
jgi:pimeloyl-ACP methyl ester carboxylesterase